jgi:hypothetical protein
MRMASGAVKSRRGRALALTGGLLAHRRIDTCQSGKVTFTLTRAR